MYFGKKHLSMETIIQFITELLIPTKTICIDGFVVTIQCQIAPMIVAGIVAGISALASAGTSIAGGIKNKQSQRLLDEQISDNERRYLEEHYRGALENDASKAYLKRLTSEMDRRDKALENSVIATGATHENALAQRQANNEVLSDAIAGLVEREETRKENAENRYLTLRDSQTRQQTSQNAAVANNWAQLGEGISSAAGSLAAAYMLDGKVV